MGSLTIGRVASGFLLLALLSGSYAALGECTDFEYRSALPACDAPAIHTQIVRSIQDLFKPFQPNTTLYSRSGIFYSCAPRGMYLQISIL